MPEFKNYVSYEGNREQLERFAEELVKLGYIADTDIAFSTWSEDKTNILINDRFCPNGIFGYYNHDGVGNACRFKPEQFEQALKAATERA